MTPKLRRVVASVAAWIVGATAAVGVGLLALSVVRGGLDDQKPASLTPESVAELASSAAGPTPGPTRSGGDGDHGREREDHASSSPAPGDHGEEKVLTSPGGTAVATCGSRGAYLVSWSPAQGYRVHEVHRGPDSSAKVEFESSSRKISLIVRCVGGVPQADIRQESR